MLRYRQTPRTEKLHKSHRNYKLGMNAEENERKIQICSAAELKISVLFMSVTILVEKYTPECLALFLS